MSQEYTVVIEKTERNFSAYVPDLPGCVSTGKTLEQVTANMRDALRLHIAGMKEDGEIVPTPSAIATKIVV